MLEVVIPATSLDLTTVDAVNAELGLEGNTADDAMIAGYVSAASDAISRYCRRVFAGQEYRETFWPRHRRHELLLSRYPVAEVASVTEGNVTLADDDAVVNPDNGFLTRLVDGNPAWWPYCQIVVTYTAGFDISNTTTGFPTLPPALDRAAVMLSVTFYRERKRDPAVRSVQSGDNRVDYGLGLLAGASALPPEVVALVAPFKDYRIR